MTRTARAAIRAEGPEEGVVEINGTSDVVGANDAGGVRKSEHVRPVRIGPEACDNPKRHRRCPRDDTYAHDPFWLHPTPFDAPRPGGSPRGHTHQPPQVFSR